MGEYSQLLPRLISECNSAIEWVSDISPLTLMQNSLTTHADAFYKARVTSKTRIFILKPNEYNKLLDAANVDLMKQFLADNSGVFLRFARKDVVQSNYSAVLVDDYGVYDQSVVIQWTGSRPGAILRRNPKGRLILGDDAGRFKISIATLKNDRSGVLKEFEHDATSNQIREK
jgi:hypothetical protein